MNYKRKVYTQLSTDHSLKTFPLPQRRDSEKKIIPSNSQGGIREEFKKVFLPLLIEVFELRQQIDTFKMQQEGAPAIEKLKVSPEQALKRLMQIQETIEETMRWCEGVIPQIARAITDAQEILKTGDEEHDE